MTVIGKTLGGTSLTTVATGLGAVSVTALLVIVGAVLLLMGCWLLDRWAGRRQLKSVLGDEQQSARLAALPAETVAAVLGEPLPRRAPRAVDQSERGP